MISCDLTREQVLACRALDRCATTNTERERENARDRKEISVLDEEINVQTPFLQMYYFI